MNPSSETTSLSLQNLGDERYMVLWSKWQSNIWHCWTENSFSTKENQKIIKNVL